MNTTLEKKCTKCKITKKLSEFYFRKDRNKYRDDCKDCISKDRKDSYWKTHKKLKRIIKCKCIVCGVNFHRKLSQVKKSGGKYCGNECRYEDQKNTLQGHGNPNYRHGLCGTTEYSTYHNNIRRVISSGNGDTSAIKIKKFKLESTYCYWCGVKFNKKNTINLDHYTPLAKGGLNNMNNIVASCKSCNSKKHAIDPYKYANKIGRLL